MYLQTFGGSAILHLIAAHPRVVALFGIAATVATLTGAVGPVRHAGTARHLEQLDAAVRIDDPVALSRWSEAEAVASAMLERRDDPAIAEAVAYTLRRCGTGCTDLTTRAIVEDPVLLRRVLVLYQLDKPCCNKHPHRGSRASRVIRWSPGPGPPPADSCPQT